MHSMCVCLVVASLSHSAYLIGVHSTSVDSISDKGCGGDFKHVRICAIVWVFGS